MPNLGKLFAMYNQRTYHKTVQMWTEAICRYIYESYGKNIRTMLTFLTEVYFTVVFIWKYKVWTYLASPSTQVKVSPAL